MRSTLRVATSLLEGDPARTEATTPNTNTTIHFSCTRPPHPKTISPSRQAPRPASTKTIGSKATFNTIVQSERPSNIKRLKDRGFVGNRIAKLVTGRSQALCYQIKNDAISALVKHGAASLISLEPSNHGPVVGLAFVGGGRLHVKPASLSNDTRHVLQGQFANALHSGKYFAGATHENQ